MLHEHPGHLMARLEQTGISHRVAVPLTYSLIILTVFLTAGPATWLIRRTLIKSLIKLIRNNRLRWDDALVDYHFFTRLSWFIPVLIFYIAQDILLPPDSRRVEFIRRLILCGFIIAGIRAISALLKAVNSIYRFFAISEPVRPFGAILMLSGSSPIL